MHQISTFLLEQHDNKESTLCLRRNILEYRDCKISSILRTQTTQLHLITGEKT